MTDLQKLILDSLDQLGAMTEHELQVACLIKRNQRGGFRSTLNKLFASKLVAGTSHIMLTREGVWAIEADNVAKEVA